MSSEKFAEDVALVTRGLHWGFVTPAEAVHWATQSLSQLEAPSPALRALALSRSDDADALLDLMTPLTFGIGVTDFLPETLGLMAHAVQSDSSRASAVDTAVAEMVYDGRIRPDTEKRLADCLADYRGDLPQMLGWNAGRRNTE